MTSQKSDDSSNLFSGLGELLKEYKQKPLNKYVTKEFQDYGCRLAAELGDEAHMSLYIKLAKTIERGILESARSFVSDSNAKSRPKLFMWKVKQLRDEKKLKQSPASPEQESLL